MTHYTWIPDWLRDQLNTLAKESGPRPFLIGVSDPRLETVTDLWRRKINRVLELAGKFEDRPTPHRFRQTFARTLFQRGVPVADVRIGWVTTRRPFGSTTRDGCPSDMRV